MQNNHEEKRWTNQDLKDSYQRGRVDAGDKNHKLRYTEEDLRASFDRGCQEADKYLGSAVRGAYEEGFKAGEVNGKLLGQDEAKKSMPLNIQDATRRGEQLGREIGLQEGRAAAQRAFERSAESRKQEIIAEYIRNNSWVAKVGNQYDEFVENRKLGTLSATMKFIGKLPVGFNERMVYRLSDFRIAPMRVFGFLTLTYIVCPYIVYQIGKYPYTWISEWLDQDAHGETDNQFYTRQNVMKRCKEINKIPPEVFGLEQYTREQELRIAECKATCKEAEESYKRMVTTMKQRRKLGIGDQGLFGTRLFASHKDRLETQQDGSVSLVATKGVAVDIEKIFDELSKPNIRI